MNKKKNNLKGVIYSTNPFFEFKDENDQTETLPAKEQNLKVCINKHRAGKTVVIIKEFVGTIEDLKALSKILKNPCE